MTNLIQSLRNTLSSLKTCPQGIAGRDQRIQLLSSLLKTEGEDYAMVREKFDWDLPPKTFFQCFVSEIFFQHFPLLPLEECFPVKEGNEEIKKLFLELKRGMGEHCEKDLEEDLNSFQKTLSPTQKARFITLLPLDLVGCDDQIGICELNRRNANGELDDTKFKGFFDIFMIWTFPSHFFNSTHPFIQWVSPQLLKRIINHYHSNFYFTEGTALSFNNIESFSDACQKLFVFVDWYSKFRKEDINQLFFILKIAAMLLERHSCSVLKKLKEREIQPLNPSNIRLTPSMVSSWIPAKYRSWDVFLAALPAGSYLDSKRRKEAAERLAKFFEG